MPDLDHRVMRAPFLRRVEEHEQDGAAVQVWDLRVAQPNVSHVDSRAVHSLEHFLAVLLKQQSNRIINVAPMGCQTGFYIVTLGVSDRDLMIDLVRSALEHIENATSVPLANEIQCGWAEHHSLAGARAIASWLLRNYGYW
ncbi:MAG: S-ribosylhomocysteine lyase [Methylobacterium sp.]|jgi:S-ribosylhomocysteine lyase|nr:S-ribosylhomocysteine lyase [Methylobacterium sp.]